jgi:hypothetical protein
LVRGRGRAEQTRAVFAEFVAGRMRERAFGLLQAGVWLVGIVIRLILVDPGLSA